MSAPLAPDRGGSPQRRTALVSVGAACLLIVVKLAAGVPSGSLGLVAEALHSGTDLVAALLTFFAVGYAARPADPSHPYGHGKAEHLAALGEAAFLVAVSVAVAGIAVLRLTGVVELETRVAWWTLAAAGVVIVIDLSRTIVSVRAARRFGSAALLSNAFHFGGDLAGTIAVVCGLLGARAGHPEADGIAALFVAALVVVAASGLMKANVDVLMDRAPAADVRAAEQAIAGLRPPVELRRLRLRHAAGRTFADVVIGVSPGAAVGQGHAAADRVESALQRALPGSDVVVHVEPTRAEAALRERVRAAAMSVGHVREIHDLVLIDTGDHGVEASLHLKLPGAQSLDEAHTLAESVEAAIRAAVPEISAVQTHLEPLAESATGSRVAGDAAAIERAVRVAIGQEPRELRLLHTENGLVVLLTLALDGATTLAAAHDEASRASRAVRAALPGIADVVVHTEP
ncbi:MAG: cation diffusion facilitator family transporter [Gaiellales bacterium]